MNDQDLEDIANEAFNDQYQGDNFRKSLLHAVKTAMLQASPPSGGEPVYQVVDKFRQGIPSWVDVSYEDHDDTPIEERRILYTSPRVVDEVPQYVQAMRVQQWLCDEHDFIVPSQDIEDAMNNPLPPDSCVEIL